MGFSFKWVVLLGRIVRQTSTSARPTRVRTVGRVATGSTGTRVTVLQVSVVPG